MEAKDDSTAVKAAQAALSAAQERASVSRPAEALASDAGRDTGPRPRVGIAVALAVVAASAGAIRLGRAEASARGCPAITYAMRGPAPIEARHDFTAATAEIARHTGFVFVPAAADVDRATLVVDWTDKRVPDAGTEASQTAVPHRVLGHGTGSWRTVNGRLELVTGGITIDATRAWTYGLDQGDTLGAVFVHELGHMLGLGHNPQPTSFMYSTVQGMRPQWTPPELATLAQVAHQAGCPPAPSPRSPRALARVGGVGVM